MSLSCSDANIARAREYFPRGLFQPEESFRFSLDALLLAAYAVLRRPGWRRLADLGCGAGPVAFGALLLAENMSERWALGLEEQSKLLAAARLNAFRLGLGGAFRARRANFLDYAAGKAAGSFDLITANPPYRLPGEGRLPPSELRRAALFGGPELLAAFVRAGRALLAPGGVFCLVFPFRRLEELGALLKANGLDVFDLLPVSAREGAEPGLVLVSACLGGTGYKDLAVLAQKPLILYERAVGGGERLADRAVEFCRFLTCNSR